MPQGPGKAGCLVHDPEHDYLDLLPDDDDAMSAIVGVSITYRLAFGPNAGKRALTLQTVPAAHAKMTKLNELVSRQPGYSDHAPPIRRHETGILSLDLASDYSSTPATSNSPMRSSS